MWFISGYLLYSTLYDIYAPTHVKNWKQTLIFVPIFKLIGIFILNLREKQWCKIQPIDRNLICSTFFYSASTMMTYLTFHFYNISALDYSILTKPKIFWCVLLANPTPLSLFVSAFTFAGLFRSNNNMVKLILTLKCAFSAAGSFFSAKYVLFGKKEADSQQILNRVYTFTLASAAWSLITTVGTQSPSFKFNGLEFCIFNAINSLLVAFILSKRGPVVREGLSSLKDIIFMLSARRYSPLLLSINLFSAYFLNYVKTNGETKVETVEEIKERANKDEDNNV